MKRILPEDRLKIGWFCNSHRHYRVEITALQLKHFGTPVCEECGKNLIYAYTALEPPKQ